METKLKNIVCESLLFSFIGFLVYLLIIAAGFMGCCFNVTNVMFNQIIVVLAISGALAFGIGSYFLCFKKKAQINGQNA